MSNTFHEGYDDISHIELVQGGDFDKPTDYLAILGAIEAKLGALSICPENIIFTGYDASMESTHAKEHRTQTYGVTLEEFREGSRSRTGTNPLQYAGLGKKWSRQPTLAIYDTAEMVEQPEEKRYTTIRGKSIDEHKVAEIHLYTSSQP